MSQITPNECEDDSLPCDFGEDDCMIVDESGDDKQSVQASSGDVDVIDDKTVGKMATNNNVEQTAGTSSDTDKKPVNTGLPSAVNTASRKRELRSTNTDSVQMKRVTDCSTPPPETSTTVSPSSSIFPSPSQYRDLKACKHCGKLGIPDSFYSKSKRFCSLACSRATSLGSSKAAVADDKSVLVQSTPSLTPTGSKPGMSNKSSGLSSAVRQGTTRPFDWKEYLVKEKADAAPVTCFKHCPLSDTWHKALLVGARVEYINTQTEVTEYPVYWFVSVVDLAGYGARVRYEGYEDDSSHDFWINLCSKDVHHVGWCAANARPLVPPKALQYQFPDWKEYLMQKLTGANTLPQNFQSKIKSAINQWPFRPGMKLEVVDRTCLSSMTVANVEQVVGGRLKLSYTLSETPDDFFWCHSLSSLIHPVGWSHSVGHKITTSPASKNASSSKGFNKLDAKPNMFARLKSQSVPFEIGMKLETVDPLNLGTICVATVCNVLNDGYVMIGIDTTASGDTKAAAKRLDTFCHHWSSPYIFPVGFCERNYLRLSTPQGCNMPFSWPEYLSSTQSVAAPEECFNKDVPKHNFKIGMKLEAVDLIEPRLICIATVVNVVGRLLKIQFDGWDSVYDQWMDCQSADIYPLGWSEIVGHPLEGPQEPAVFKVEKKKSKFHIFRGSRKKRKSKQQTSVVSSAQTSSHSSPVMSLNSSAVTTPNASLTKKAKISVANESMDEDMPKLVAADDCNISLSTSAMPELSFIASQISE